MTPSTSSTSRDKASALILVAAGIYNLAWGGWVILYPLSIFEFAQLPTPNYPQIWQCVGMIVGVYGIGYLIAATNPTRHWPIVLVGLLGKVFGPIGFLWSASSGALPWSWGVTILSNDLVWWIPFGYVLFQAFSSATDTGKSELLAEFEEVVDEVRSHRGATIRELSTATPLLLVFVRHAGCTFCREALQDLARVRSEIEGEGIEIAIVHMSRPMEATQLMTRYGLEDVHRFHDPCCTLYRTFGVARGSFNQLLGPKVWWSGFRAAILEGHGIGKLSGDGFRLAAAFLMRYGKIVAEQHANSSSDRIDFKHLATCTSCQSVGDNSEVLQAAH